MGIPKLSMLRLLQVWGPITLCVDLQLRWGLKLRCNLHRELSNDMSHPTYTRENCVDSWLLMVGIQIINLTPNTSFGHNLCFKCPDDSCKLILDIYVLIAFQLYKWLFNPMGFDPCNCFLKIWEFTGSPPPKMGVHLGMWVFILSYSPTFSHSQDHEMWVPGFSFGPHPCKPLPWSQA
jgi:hypothetical protein